jgi:hypothetical protein
VRRRRQSCRRCRCTAWRSLTSGIVAEKPPNKAGRRRRRRWSQGRRPWGNAASKAHSGLRAGTRVTKALGRVRHARKAQEEGEVHRASASNYGRPPSRGVLRAQAQRCSQGGRGDVGGLRGRSRAAAGRPAWTGPSRSVSAAARPPDLHTEGGWKAAAAGDRRPGGQDPPGRHGHVLNGIYEEEFLGFSYGSPLAADLMMRWMPWSWGSLVQR